ncbi:MAG: hypothetical protein QOK43_1593 [Acidimicrobiaceae bacterium]|nr:hypothetical protein [Acidimicrobiaceae bacterium]
MVTADVPAPDATELEAARSRLGLSVSQVWIAYFAIGGNARQRDVESWLSGATYAPDREHDLLAVALNEELAARGLDRMVPYRNDVRP